MKNDDDFIHLPELYIKLSALKKHLQKTYKLNINPMKNSDQNVNWSDLDKNLNAGYDDEKMAMISCDIIHEYAVKLDKVVKEDTELEEWVKSKIAKTEQMMASVKHALIGIEKYDHGGELFKQQLLHIGKYAQAIIEALQDGTELMSWMESNLAVCADHMDNVYHHLDYKMGNRAKDLDKMKNGGGIEEKNYNSEELLDTELNEYASRNGYEVLRNVHHATANKNVPPYKTDYFLEKDGKEIYVGTWDYESNKGSVSLAGNKMKNGGGVGVSIVEKMDKIQSFLEKNGSNYEKNIKRRIKILYPNVEFITEDYVFEIMRLNDIKELTKYDDVKGIIDYEETKIDLTFYKKNKILFKIKDKSWDSDKQEWFAELIMNDKKIPFLYAGDGEDEQFIQNTENALKIAGFKTDSMKNGGGVAEYGTPIAMMREVTGKSVGTVPVSEEIYSSQVNDFVNYVYEVYEEQGYTKAQVKTAVNKYIKDLGKEFTYGGGDSLDRERVYEYLLNPSLKGIKNPMFANGGGVGQMNNVKSYWNMFDKNKRIDFLIGAGYSKSVAEDLSNEDWDSLEVGVHKDLLSVIMANGGGIGNGTDMIELHLRYNDAPVYINPNLIGHIYRYRVPRIGTDGGYTQLGVTTHNNGGFEVTETPEEIIELIKLSGANKMVNGGNVGRDAMFRSQEPHEQRYDRKREYKEYKKEGWLANDWFKNGGGVGNIPNNYENKNPSDVWDMWTPKQREHFLQDHVSGWIKYDTRIAISKMNWKEFHNVDDNTFNSIARQLESHVLSDQYNNGGGVGIKYYVMDAKSGEIVSKGFDTEEESKVEMYRMFEETGNRFLTQKTMANGGGVKGSGNKINKYYIKENRFGYSVFDNNGKGLESFNTEKKAEDFVKYLNKGKHHYAADGTEVDPLKKKGDIVTYNNNFYEVLGEYTAYNSGAAQYARENEGAALPAGLDYGYSYTALKLRNLETGVESSGSYSNYEKIKREDVEGLIQAKLVKDADDKIKEQKRKAEQDAERVIRQAKMEEAERVRNLSKGDIELAKELISDWKDSIIYIDYTVNSYNELDVLYTYDKYLGEIEPSEEYFITFKVDVKQTSAGYYEPGDRWTPDYGEDAQYKFSLDRVYIEKNGVQVYEGKVEFVELFDKFVIPKIDDWKELNDAVDQEYTEWQKSY